jgi:aldose 1-epimerase
MFHIKTGKKNSDFIEIYNKNIGLKAAININEGARLKTLILNNIPLITQDENSNYKESFASAILFPFANRIKNGRYKFKNKSHQLNCNESNRNNAIHGLVYDKTFELKKIKIKNNKIYISLIYKEKKTTKGFPYAYNLRVTYIFSKKSTNLIIDIKNKSLESFPFTLGWHPYFNSSNLHDSSLAFKSSKKIIFDENLITKEIVKKDILVPVQIKNTQFDDCFITKDNKVTFKTPNYTLTLRSNPSHKYFQIYNPKNSNKIALEFMSGVSNSFNNKIGLQELNPNETYSTSHVLNITNNHKKSHLKCNY